MVLSGKYRNPPFKWLQTPFPVFRASKVVRQAETQLRARISTFLSNSSDVRFTLESTKQELKNKSVSYTGEEISLARRLRQIERSLPPSEHGGSIHLEDWVSGHTARLLQSPALLVLPPHERKPGPSNAEFISPQMRSWRFLSRNIITWVSADVPFRDEEGVHLNGLFGVEKPNRFTADGHPILRVIMDFRASNRLQREILETSQCYRPRLSGYPSFCTKAASSNFTKVIWPMRFISLPCQKHGCRTCASTQNSQGVSWAYLVTQMQKWLGLVVFYQ